MSRSLVRKYSAPGPRYTSYPTVSSWDTEGFNAEQWLAHVTRCFTDTNDADGVSVCIRLPFCETPCTFCHCGTKSSFELDVEASYANDVLREWQLYGEHFDAAPRIKQLHLGGTATFLSASRLSKLMDSIIARAQITETCEFGFEANPSSTTQEHLRMMRAHGFGRLSLAVNDLNPVVQQVINKIAPFEEVARVVEIARRLDYSSISFDLMYGLPRQQLAGLVWSIEQMVSLRPERIRFYGYQRAPVARDAVHSESFTTQIPLGEQKQALYEVGRELLIDAGYHQIGMEHFVLETDALYIAAQARSLHKNVTGYTPVQSQLCIGLGLSAIGDAWYAFAQNEKSLKAYHTRVSAGELPVFRGHQLTAEDRVLRRHILDLLCNNETDLAHGVSGLDCAAECSARLAALHADDLVELDGSRVRVTLRGRAFLGKICMAFDARLWRGKSSWSPRSPRSLRPRALGDAV